MYYRMAGPMRQMQQANMAPPHQPQHPHPHRNPHVPHLQQQMPMNALQHPPHQIHDMVAQSGPIQPVLLGINMQHTNGTLIFHLFNHS